MVLKANMEEYPTPNRDGGHRLQRELRSAPRSRSARARPARGAVEQLRVGESSEMVRVHEASYERIVTRQVQARTRVPGSV
jgi:hypothetical protein